MYTFIDLGLKLIALYVTAILFHVQMWFVACEGWLGYVNQNIATRICTQIVGCQQDAEGYPNKNGDTETNLLSLRISPVYSKCFQFGIRDEPVCMESGLKYEEEVIQILIKCYGQKASTPDPRPRLVHSITDDRKSNSSIMRLNREKTLLGVG